MFHFSKDNLPFGYPEEPQVHPREGQSVTLEQISLTNYLKYCLGYVKLTRERTFTAQHKSSIGLGEQYFDLQELLQSDITEAKRHLIELNTFYSLNPKEISQETQEAKAKYQEEKRIATKIEEVYNKYKNDQFTKQIFLNFGFYEIELPKIQEDTFATDDLEDVIPEDSKKQAECKVDRYPLYSIPIVVEKESGKYLVRLIDPDIQVNIGALEQVLGENLYYQLVDKIGQYELGGRLSTPLRDERFFDELWNEIRAQLKLTEARFDEKSFILKDVSISIAPRANYFLAEDLLKLSKLSDDKLEETSLISWSRNEEISIESEVPKEEKGELYYPFKYDKFQLKVLKHINNKASIVQGPPGTGKSETISNLLCHLSASGKKVLFVSQKAQALKVVKDKLKEARIKYLFGYIPNPRSTLINEEDERDGIAQQLTALKKHVTDIEFKKESLFTRKSSDDDIVSVAKEEDDNRVLFNKAIEEQRQFFSRKKELDELREYEVSIQVLDSFKKNFSTESFQRIGNIKADIEKLEKEINSYEKNCGDKKEALDKQFGHLPLRESAFAEFIKRIKDDVAQRGYDGHNKIVRYFKNIGHKSRLKKVYAQLPREFIDYINKHLKEVLSKAQVVNVLEELYMYCRYYGQSIELEVLEKNLRVTLSSCGLSSDAFAETENIIKRKGETIEEIKSKILNIFELRNALKRLNLADPNILNRTIEQVKKSRQERVKTYIQNIIDNRLYEEYKKQEFRQVAELLAKTFGRSKKAFKTFDRIKSEPKKFKTILNLIPVWIMELDDASRIIPFEPALFDYIIFDESSQCNVAYAMPAMYRSRRAIFFGDSEQMRDDTIRFKSNLSLDTLACTYKIPQELQIKSTGEPVQSVLDVAALRGFKSTVLRYHYRSTHELIGFSNKYFYIPKGKDLIALCSNYMTYKDTNRIIVIHHVDVDWTKEISDKTNYAEAKKILELVEELNSDEKYKNKSIGILTFFNAQASLIRKMLEDAGYTEENHDIKIGIIEGIQGDEKDIIIYSFVISSPDQKNRYTSLAGEGGEVNKDIAAGRVNVAFSRAKLQVHCVVSMPIDKFPEGIWIKKYLGYASKNGDINISTDLKPFDSYFEEEFYYLAYSKLGKQYKIQNQVRSCGSEIDFVIINTINGNKVAIECDGPSHFKDEIDEQYGIYVESDEERMRVLNAAGWTVFYRIKYSDWIDKRFDRTKLLKDIRQILD